MKTQKLFEFYRKLRQSRCIVIIVLIKYLYYWVVYGKKIIAHQRTKIRGVKNILMSKQHKLYIGVDGFSNHETILDVYGNLYIGNNVSIKRGCVIGVSKGANMFIWDNVHISFDTVIHVKNRLSIGKSSSISWNCHITDDDWHEINYPDKKDKSNNIVIEDHVLIGHHSSIGKGVSIAEGVVIQSNSVINQSIKECNVIVTTNSLPKIIKQNVNWI